MTNMNCDVHLHSSFSSDSEAPMEQMVLRAIDLGLQTICFTEHLDLDYPENEEGLTFQVDLFAYEKELRLLQVKYQDRLQIGYGIELGMQHHLMDAYARLIAGQSFDFIIASQHLTDGADPYERAFWIGKQEDEVYRHYFQELYDNLAAMPDFDTAAHLDYIVRYGPNQNTFYDYETYAAYIDPILKLLIERKKCLEVNTAGLAYGLGQTNPCEAVLRRYFALGGRLLTLGSDAHTPGRIAWQFSETLTLLRQIGFPSVCVFQKRKRQEMTL